MLPAIVPLCFSVASHTSSSRNPTQPFISRGVRKEQRAQSIKQMLRVLFSLRPPRETTCAKFLADQDNSVSHQTPVPFFAAPRRNSPSSISRYVYHVALFYDSLF